jgi:uncharacterized membrane-anchored protein
MYDGENRGDSLPTSAGTKQYTARSATRRRSGSGVRRIVFFTLASVWGFIAGVTGVLASLSAVGQNLQARPAIIWGLIPAIILTLAGGFVAAAAYRESKLRAR